MVISFLIGNAFGSAEVLAALLHNSDNVSVRKKNKNDKSNSSELVVNGSVLNSSKNVIKTKKLPKDILRAIKKSGSDNLSVRLTKIIEGSGNAEFYTLGSDGVELKKKRLVLNLFANLLNSGGAVVTAGALEGGKYKLTVIVSGEEFDVKDIVSYNRPVVVTGTVEDCGGGGTEKITDENGKDLSGLVALTSDCVYINEVTADRLVIDGSIGRVLAQTGESMGTEMTSGSGAMTGISEATTNNGMQFQAPFELDPTQNGQMSVDPNFQNTFEVNSAMNFGGPIGGEGLKAPSLKCPPLLSGAAEEFCPNIELSEGCFFPCQPIFRDEESEVFSCKDKLPSCRPNVDLLACGKALALVISGGVSVVADKTQLSLQVGADETGLKECLPPFVVDEVIPNLQTDDDFIDFATKFLQNATETNSEPDQKDICEDLKNGIGPASMSMGAGNQPPPCIPDGLTMLCNITNGNKCSDSKEPCSLGGNKPKDGATTLAQTTPPLGGNASGEPPTGGGTQPDADGNCPEGEPFKCPDGRCVLDEKGCISPDGGGSGQPPVGEPNDGGKPPQGEFMGGQGCIENTQPGPSDLCEPCESDSDCKNPVRVLTPDGCLLPGVICADEFGSLTGAMICILETLDAGTLSAEGADSTKQSSHNGGSVDPFTCDEHPFNCGDIGLPPIDQKACNPFTMQGGINKDFKAFCCFDVNKGGPGNPPLRLSLEGASQVDGGNPSAGGKPPKGPDPRGCICKPDNFDADGNLLATAEETIKDCLDSKKGDEKPLEGQNDCPKQCEEKCGFAPTGLALQTPPPPGGDGTQSPPGGDGMQPPSTGNACFDDCIKQCGPPSSGDPNGGGSKPPTGGDQNSGGTQPDGSGSCPASEPFKCPDGKCVLDEKGCIPPSGDPNSGGTQSPPGGDPSGGGTKPPLGGGPNGSGTKPPPGGGPNGGGTQPPSPPQ